MAKTPRNTPVGVFASRISEPGARLGTSSSTKGTRHRPTAMLQLRGSTKVSGRFGADPHSRPCIRVGDWDRRFAPRASSECRNGSRAGRPASRRTANRRPARRAASAADTATARRRRARRSSGWSPRPTARERQREHAGDERDGRHQNRPQAVAVRLDDGRVTLHAAARADRSCDRSAGSRSS